MESQSNSLPTRRKVLTSKTAIYLVVLFVVATATVVVIWRTRIDRNETSRSSAVPAFARFTIAMTSTCNGGERTRVLIDGSKGGNVMVSSPSAAYQYTMSMTLSSPFAGSANPSYWCTNAEQVIRGHVDFRMATFESDRDYNLTFKLCDPNRPCTTLDPYYIDPNDLLPKSEKKTVETSPVNFTYLCGRGTITEKSGKVTRLGYEDTVDTWLPYLTSTDNLAREGAAQALGVLTKQRDVERVTPKLIEALGDEADEVRRNAAEALGKIGSVQAVKALTIRTDPAVEKDEWVRKVAVEALKTFNR